MEEEARKGEEDRGGKMEGRKKEKERPEEVEWMRWGRS